jgi:Prenyltransferase and squalene oxidase repeat
VSWQVGSLAVLGLALAAGFGWYERSRPDARVVALVGTLAAFAALGRVAFAAVPNVKPTTDIVLISGFALGAGPGFAVGAVAGLSSNFFFGQGPWTPWQMAAWGATGVAGALLAWLVSRRGRRLPAHVARWPLALICAAVGFAFTAIQDVGDWVTYSDHGLASLGVYVGQGLGFDGVHAAGCLLFALALGPALISSVQRFARRLEVQWVEPSAAATVIAVLAAVVAIAPAPRADAATTSASAAATRGAAYLESAQNRDGGFGAAPGQPSAQLYAGWAALGLASAGRALGTLADGGATLVSYLRAGVTGSIDTGSLERTILAVRAAGLPADSFAGHDLVAALERRFARDGSVADQVNLTAFAILALRAAGVAPRPRTWSWLLRQRDADGGFGFSGAGATSDCDDTGAVLEALAGRRGGAVAAVRERAVAFLRSNQDRDGGFPSQAGDGSNAQSTAWAVQGLAAAGVDVAGVRRASSPSPLAYLVSLQSSDGRFAYARGVTQTPVWVTGEVLRALEREPLPIAAPPAPAGSATRTSTSTTTTVAETSTTAGGAAAAATTAAGSPTPGSRSGHAGHSSPKQTTSRRPGRIVPAGRSIVRLARTVDHLTVLALAPLRSW